MTGATPLPWGPAPIEQLDEVPPTDAPPPDPSAPAAPPEPPGPAPELEELLVAPLLELALLVEPALLVELLEELPVLEVDDVMDVDDEEEAVDDEVDVDEDDDELIVSHIEEAAHTPPAQQKLAQSVLLVHAAPSAPGAARVSTVDQTVFA
jgi:hypothetical protein